MSQQGVMPSCFNNKANAVKCQICRADKKNAVSLKKKVPNEENKIDANTSCQVFLKTVPYTAPSTTTDRGESKWRDDSLKAGWESINH